jgi:hypothetical protein
LGGVVSDKQEHHGRPPKRLPEATELRRLLLFQSRGVTADQHGVKGATVERALLRDAKEAA